MVRKEDNEKNMGSIFFRHEVKDYNRKGGKDEEYTKELIIDGTKGLSISFTENIKGKYNGKYIRENKDKGTYEVIIRKDDKEDKKELSLAELKKFVKKELKFADKYVNTQRGKFAGGAILAENATESGQCGGARKSSRKSSKKSSKKSSRKSSRKSSKKSSKKMSGGAKKRSKKGKSCSCGSMVGGSWGCEKCSKPSKKSSKKRSKKSSKKSSKKRSKKSSRN
jgi:hypothetical protein